MGAAIRDGSTENGVFGARVMWGTMDEIVAKLRTAYRDRTRPDFELLTGVFGRIRFVLLYRDDIVAQAVSWARAEQTGHWQRGDTTVTEPHFDFSQIRGLVRSIEEHNAAWQCWLASLDVQPHMLRYEELVADTVGAAHGILEFLGLQLPDDRKISSRHGRQADEINDEWIARYGQSEAGAGPSG